MATKQELARKLDNIHEVAYHATVRQMLSIRDKTFDALWEIFSGSVIKPDAAPFVVGRLWQAFDEHRKAVALIAEYETARDKMTEILREESLPAHPGAGAWESAT
jgi:hypothetical protein